MENSRYLTVDETIAWLKHTSDSVLFVEGDTDKSIFDALDNMDDSDLRIHPCNGRAAVLELYRRRDEYSHVPCVFLADKDQWVFDNRVPEEYDEVVFTSGYSIENDIIRGSSFFDNYSESDCMLFGKIRNEISKWWAFQIAEYKSSGRCASGKKLNQVIDFSNYPDGLNLKAEKIPNFTMPSEEEINDVIMRFSLIIQGHLLVEIHRFVLSHSGKKSMRRMTSLLIEECLLKGHQSETFIDLKKRIMSYYRNQVSDFNDSNSAH